MPAPTDFTPEITEDFYNRLAGRVKKQGDVDRGRARGEALARGLEGDAFERSAVSAAEGQTSENLADLDADIAYRMAGLGREERVGREQREDVQQFEVDESNRQFPRQKELARMGYDFQRDMAKTANRRSQQGALWSLGAGLVGRGLGAALF